MLRPFLFLIPLLCTLVVSAQSGKPSVRRYVKGNTVPIVTINPDSMDFSDLEPIGEAIGDARIVMLGEQSHGDGATFMAKARLIKYLREKKGFNVLAFESDFFALTHGWDQLEKKDEAIRNFIPRNIFTIWTNADQLKEFFYSYVPATYQTTRPLTITGFDCQLGQWHSRIALKDYLNNYLAGNDVAFCRTPEYANEFLPFLDSLVRLASSRDVPRLQQFEQFVNTIQQQLSDHAKSDFGMILLDNLKEYSRENQYLDADFYKAYEIRDAQMARNLNWLAETRFPNEKIIVWAASGHIMKSRFEGADKSKGPTIVTPMGKFFTDAESNRTQTYILGFTSRTGQFGKLGDKIVNVPRLPRATKGSFETWIKRRYDYVFVDFKPFNEQYPGFSEPFFMKGKGHWGTSLPWNRAFDGVFYIRNMFPPDRNEEAIKRLQVDTVSWSVTGVAVRSTKSLKNKKVRFAAKIRFEGDERNTAFMRIGVNERVAEYVEIKPGDWKEYEVISEAGKRPKEIRFNIQVGRKGATLYIDDAVWYVEKNKKWQPLTTISNFEAAQPGEVPKGWYVNGKNYTIETTEEAAFGGTKSLRIKIPDSN